MAREKQPQAKRPQQKLRIIGGQWRGRKLDFPLIEGLRPTGDRIRETLFNWLAPYLGGSYCLDLFAGSGALGFEAASRGAASVAMLELNNKAFKQLQNNQQLLHADSVQLFNADSLQWLMRSETPADIIFIDPPFGKNLVETSIQTITERQLISKGGMVYLEMASEAALPPLNGLSIVKEKTTGNVCYRLLAYK